MDFSVRVTLQLMFMKSAKEYVWDQETDYGRHDHPHYGCRGQET